jgi:hypothetical protein
MGKKLKQSGTKLFKSQKKMMAREKNHEEYRKKQLTNYSPKHEKYKKLEQTPTDETLEKKLEEDLKIAGVGKLHSLATRLTKIKPNKGSANDKLAGRTHGRYLKGKL